MRQTIEAISPTVLRRTARRIISIKDASSRKLFALAVLLFLCSPIFGCGEDTTQEPAPTVALNSVQIAAIADQVSASIRQTLRSELAGITFPLSEDEIRTLIEDAVIESAPKGISSADIQAIVDGVTSSLPAQGVTPDDVATALSETLSDICAACEESNVEDHNTGETMTEPDMPRLQTIQERGRLICAVNSEFPAFGYRDDQGNFAGFDIDLCRAVAAAVLGNANAVDFRPTAAADRGPSMQSGEIDMMSRNTTWTTSRDATWGNFAHTMFYDGQGFIVPRSLGISSIYDMSGATICVLRGTLTELNLLDFDTQNNMNFTIVRFEDYLRGNEAYLQGQCQSLTMDQSSLVATVSRFPNPGDHVILPETISDKPLGPIVPHDDDQWFDVVKTVMAMLIYAEAFGIHSDNVPTDNTGYPDIDRLFGLDGSYGQQALGLKATAAQDVIKQVGNYGQIYERNFVDLGLERRGSRNALWIGALCTDCPKGGQIYAAPLH